MATIMIRQWGKKIQSSRTTILESALESGVPFPHGCLSGRCGQCKSRLTRGKVVHSSYFEQALSADELANGLILPCCASARTDIDIAWTSTVEPINSLPPKRYRAKVISVVRVSDNVSCIRLAPRGNKVQFSAGQYARLQFSTLQARAYSFANRPDESLLEFHIRKVPGGQVSSYVNNQLAIGETVRFEAPFGVSQLRENHQGRIIALANGTGLAPALSIVRSALRLNHQRECHLYFSARIRDNLYYTRELSLLLSEYQNLYITIILAEPDNDSAFRTGPIHAVLADDFTELSNTKIYAAGSPSMIAATTQAALDGGVSAGDIHADTFTASAREKLNMPVHVLSEFLELFMQRSSS
ncbi:MAG: FAD-binding oxidoreductase [Granulosicoccus sp.]